MKKPLPFLIGLLTVVIVIIAYLLYHKEKNNHLIEMGNKCAEKRLCLDFDSATCIDCLDKLNRETSKMETFTYKGASKTLWNDVAKITLSIHTDNGTESGSFELCYDYDNTKSYEGMKVEDFSDRGFFTTEKNKKWGDVYVLKGESEVELYYQAIDNKLKELNHEKKDYTDIELTQVFEEVVQTGNDKDSKGCISSAGYTWSFIKNECIRTFEVADLQLVQKEVAGTYSSSLAVIFNNTKTKAEIFLPGKESLILEQTSNKKGNFTWKNQNYKLVQSKGYVLLEKGKIIFQTK